MIGVEEYFYTAASRIEVINKVKDSKFFASIAPINNEEDANDFVSNIKNKYHDASHNVSAYKLGTGDQAIKYSNDDGEPAGSSGPPVLQAIEGEGLSNTVIVVTRYFGGTKLGIGGLIRAYGNSAKLAIKEAGIKKLELFDKLIISGTYQLIGTILGQIEAVGGQILSTDYKNDGGDINVLIRPVNYQTLEKKLIEHTGNKVDIRVVERVYL